MADKNSRFNMRISYEITKPGESGAITQGSLDYKNMDYVQICVTQQAIVNFAQDLVDMGFQNAVVIGMGDEVAAAKAIGKK